MCGELKFQEYTHYERVLEALRLSEFFSACDRWADETKKRTPPHRFQRGCWIEQASCVAVVLSVAVAVVGGWYYRLIFVERGLVKGVPPKTARPRGKWNISSFRTRNWEMRGPKGQLTRALESKSISIFTCKHIQRSEYSQLVSINK